MAEFQNQGQMANRAKWVMKYEKGLVDILHENNVSLYRTPTGWRTDGWRKIVSDFNERFPEAKFTKMQIQEHETQLKKDYKLIKSILQRDGVSWDQCSSMIKTTDEIWDEIIEENAKARKYQRASFPLLDSLELLFDGPIREASTFSIPQHVGNVDEGGNDMSTPPGMSGRPCGMVNASTEDGWNSISLLQLTALEPQGIDDLVALQNHAEEVLERPQHGVDQRPQRGDEPAQSSSCIEPQKDKRKKRKIQDIQQTMEAYLEFRMKQARMKEQRVKEQRMKEQQAKGADQFSISSCIKSLHNLPGVSDQVKLLASDVFKDPENREIFLSYEPKLRALWLKREIDRQLS